MRRPHPLRALASLNRTHIALGLSLALIWAFHAAAYGVLGRAYFHVVHLNDASKPVGPQVFLHPAFLGAALVLLVRGRELSTRRLGSQCGIVAALGCWLFAATMSALFNPSTEVMLTYCCVFLAGAVVYVVLARTRVPSQSLEIALLGLALGSLVPLVGGIQAFVREWGAPDIRTTLSAYQNLFRMELYEAATFGSRGNTATFVIIIAPLFLSIALDRSRSRLIRLVSAALMVPIAMNIMILEIRAAFLSLLFALAAVFGFKLGLRRYPIFAAALALAVLMVVRYSPDVADTFSDRLRPVMTFDTVEDASVMERAASIDEGLVLAKRHWLLGIGPGGAVKKHTQTAAHQFQVQQFMEGGVFGLLASALFSLGVLLMLGRTLLRGQDFGINNTRFALLIGPATFVVYGTISNPTLNVGYVNTWTILVASMVALAPGFEVARTRRLAEI
jgi:hypothetical protein